MNYDYKQRTHNKIFKREKFIYKFCKTKKKYKVERDFYLLANKLLISNMPKLYYFSDKRFLLILENVGKQITPIYFRNNLEKIHKIYENIKNLSGYYQNDILSKNICIKNNNLFIIDFELANKNHRILNKKGEYRNEFYKMYY